MPLIAFDPFGTLIGLARHTPIPTVNSYIGVSVALAVCSALYTKLSIVNSEVENFLHGINTTHEWSEFVTGTLSPPLLSRKFYYLLLHPTIGWVFVNAICASLALLAKLSIHITVGKLGAQESILLRDRLCNFLLYKAVFLFGVLNTVVNEEVIAWILWFAVLATVASLQSIFAYRLKYLLSSVPSRTILVRMMMFALFLFFISVGFVLFSIWTFKIFSINIALFIFADALKTLLRSVYVISKCASLFECITKRFSSSSMTTATYYLELSNDLAIDMTDLLHYTHMLFYSQVVLSMACIIISMQLRSFYKSFVARIERHLKFKRICVHINKHYPQANQNEIDESNDWCAICWEHLESARKLPCNHYFHEWCLRGWLEQDSSCPTCRVALPSPISGTRAERQAPTPLMQRSFNHVFRFNGARYSRWLPSFSVELSHNVGHDFFQRERQNLDHSQLNTLAQQVQEMFPQLDFTAIMEDLRETGSLQATIENILEGRFRRQDPAFELEEDNWSGADSSSSSDSSSELQSLETLDMDENRNSSSSKDHVNKCLDNSQDTLSQRKNTLIQYNRRKYLQSSRGVNLRTLYGSSYDDDRPTGSGITHSSVR